MKLSNKYLFYLLCFVFVVVKTGKIPGHATGTLEILIGSSADITCTVDPDILHGKRNISRMYFENLSNKRIVENVEVLNETTIVYHIKNAMEQETVYRCAIGGQAIMDTKVYVGDKPRAVQDFSCTSYNFKYMTCNFTRPKNPVLTQYNLSLSINANYNVYPKCDFHVGLVVCNITEDYRPDKEVYQFKLKAANHLGTAEQSFTIKNYNVMILTNSVTKFEANATSEYLRAKWQFLYFFENKKLLWEALLIPLNMATQTVRVYRSQGWYLTAKLPYAYYDYKLQLRVRMRNGWDSAMWSAPFVYSFRSDERRPDRAPNVVLGGFHIATDLHLYWQRLQPYEYNGQNFRYSIMTTQLHSNGSKSCLETPLNFAGNSTPTFAYCSSCYYKFEIRSSNNLGLSANASIFEIYPLSEMESKVLKPRNIQKAYHLNNNSHTLSWQAPENTDELQNYTIFWCHAMDMECIDPIQYSYVSNDTYEFTTPALPTEHQLAELKMAVSANYRNKKSAGMQWNVCTDIVNRNLLKMEPTLNVLSATSIEVEWQQSICPSVLQGYNISYCESAENAECLALPQMVQVNKDATQFVLTNLKPYTNYNVQMLMYSASKSGDWSDAQIRQTNETASTPPRNLKYAELSNTSVLLTWLPPEELNGVIDYYTVYANGIEKCRVAWQGNGTISYRLNNLLPYVNYDVHVTAQTVYSSEQSNHVQFRTLIGFSLLPMKVSEMEHDEQTTTVSWSEPQNAGGRLEYYEVAVMQFHGNKKLKEHISAVPGTIRECTLRLPDYGHSQYTTTVQLRAVNAAQLPNEVPFITATAVQADIVADDNNDNQHELLCLNDGAAMPLEQLQSYQNPSQYKLYKSAWQSAPQRYRFTTKLANKWYLLTLIPVITILIAASLLWGHRWYMKLVSIECKLPDGLLDEFRGDEHKEQNIASLKTTTCISDGRLLLPPTEQQRLLLQSNDLLEIAERNTVKSNNESVISNCCSMNTQCTALSVSEEIDKETIPSTDTATDYYKFDSDNAYVTQQYPQNTISNGYVTLPDCNSANMKHLQGYVTQAVLEAYGQRPTY